MKYRIKIVRNKLRTRYYPQYRFCFIWSNFVKYVTMENFSRHYSFKTKAETIEFLDNESNENDKTTTYENYRK